MRPIVNSSKHYVQKSLFPIVAGATTTFGIVQAVEVSAVNSPEEVREGAVVKAVYVEMWIRGSEASPGSVLATLYKLGGGDTNMTTVEQAALMDYDNKKNVLYHTQGLINDNNADAIPFIRQWFKIPKSKQRFGLNDRLNLTIFAQGAIDLVGCGFMTYKEYF